jgi:hypothetical protein
VSKVTIRLTEEGIDRCFEGTRFVGLEKARAARDAEQRGETGEFSAKGLALLSFLVANNFATRASDAVRMLPEGSTVRTELAASIPVFRSLADQSQALIDELNAPRGAA